jgi:hypothetical protein
LSKKEINITQIDDAIAAAGAEFDLSSVVSKLGKDESLRRRFENTIDADERYFRDEKWHCMQRQSFFEGAEFLITPDSWEIENGFLVPGHRFVPFVDPDFFPSDVELIECSEKKAAAKSETTAPLGEIFRYHTLLGSEQLFDHLAAENPANMRLAGRPSATDPVSITVFILKDFYRKNEFAQGDALKCRVVDYKEGKVEFEFLPASERSNRKLNEFVDAFDRALGKMISVRGKYLDLPEQLAQSCYFGRSELVFTAASLEEYLKYSLRAEIRADGDFAMLTLRGADGEFDDEDDMIAEDPQAIAASMP